MNEWSTRRKRIVLLIVFSVLVFLLVIPIVLIFYRAPSCSDSKQNGGETGVDCGGSCERLCTAESLPIISLGDPRVLNVATSTQNSGMSFYEVAALFQNPNSDGEIYRAGYTIKLYGRDESESLKTIVGSTHIPRNAEFAIFEGPFEFSHFNPPVRAVFEWDESDLVWQKSTLSAPSLTVKDGTFSREDYSPRYDAILQNDSSNTVSNIEVVILLSDEAGNIFAASKTFVDTLPARGSAPIIFTWPRPFDKKIFNTGILTRVFPDRSFIR